MPDFIVSKKFVIEEAQTQSPPIREAIASLKAHNLSRRRKVVAETVPAWYPETVLADDVAK
jgi:hypothetical protein